MMELMIALGFLVIIAMVVCVARSHPFDDDEDRWGSL
jgi:hypothetical protein